MISLYVVCGLAFFFNILDSILTWVALHKLPRKLRAKEINPLMDRLMKKSSLTSNLLKHGFMVGVVTYLILSKAYWASVLLCTTLGLVVLNNSYIVIGRVLTKRKIASPLYYIKKKIRIPKRFEYIFFVSTIVVLSVGVTLLVVR